MSGQTIEILNTDAEGRLILCDAITYARRFNPDVVIDIATLTGACVIALGNTATGALGNDERLIREVLAAASSAGEPAWQLPLWDEYRELIKSDVADIKNSGGRPAGTITAALFLKEFAEGYSWVHLDIAGTAYTESDLGTLPRGPTGVPVGKCSGITSTESVSVSGSMSKIWLTGCSRMSSRTLMTKFW